MAHVDVLKAFFKACEAAPGKIDAMYAKDCEISFPGMPIRSVGQWKEVIGVFMEAFPDGEHRVVHSFESGNMLAAEIVFVGTHTGTLKSPTGNVPATGRKVELPAVDVVAFSGALIQSHHVYFDNMVFLGQLGLLPGK